MNPDMLVEFSAGLVSMLINQLAAGDATPTIEETFIYRRPIGMPYFEKKHVAVANDNCCWIMVYWMWLSVAMQQE